MAMIGDVLVKFVADFAEFSKGMEEAGRKLDQLGENVGKQNQSMTSMFNTLKGVAATVGSAFAFNEIKAYVDQIDRAVLEVDKLAKSTGLTTDEVQALQYASKQTGRSLDDLAKTGKANKAWLDELTEAFRNSKL